MMVEDLGRQIEEIYIIELLAELLAENAKFVPI
jgi:hypothetical protein